MSSPEQRCVFSLCADETLTAGLREVSGLLAHPEPPQPSANASSEGKRARLTALMRSHTVFTAHSS